MGLHKKGQNWYIDYYPPCRAGKRIREMVGPVRDEARIASSFLVQSRTAE